MILSTGSNKSKLPHVQRKETTRFVFYPTDLYQQLQPRDQMLIRVRANLLKAQTRMKKFADRKQSEVHFQVGDLVFVKLQPYCQHSVVWRKHQKLALIYFGPFPVVQKIGTIAYRLKLPTNAKIHPMFHVSLLKKCKSLATTPNIPLPLLTDLEGPIL